MFTVAQFFEKQQLRVLAVPASWVRDGLLMWPKLSSNEKLEKLRTEGAEYHGATTKIPTMTSRKYKSLKAAEAAADELLKQDVSDIEAKRKLLKHCKLKAATPPLHKDYNKILEKITASKKAGQLGSTDLSHQKQNLESPEVGPRPLFLLPQENSYGMASAPLHELPYQRTQEEVPGTSFQSLQRKASGTAEMLSSQPHNLSDSAASHPLKNISEYLNDESNPEDLDPTTLLELTQDQQQHQPIFVTDEGIVYINPSTNDSGTIGASGNLAYVLPEESKLAMESLKFEVATLRIEMVQMKHDIIDSIKTSIQQAVEECLEKNFPRFATMLDMNKRVEETATHEGKFVEDHKLINDENDIINFNKLLANTGVFNDYIKYFTKLVAPATYSERGDSACYLIVDCLFTRNFWNNFTWTGINRGNKSKRGFREFANVIQLLLGIVRVGDPAYTTQKLESFCKNRIFRYSKARSTSKQLRKSSCRPKRNKNGNDGEDKPMDGVPDNDDEDDVEYDDGGNANITIDSDADESDGDDEDEPEPGDNISMSTDEYQSQ